MDKIDLENAMYKWFNMKYELYNKLTRNSSIFLYYEGQTYADIRILKKHEHIYYKSDFRKEFTEIFPMEIDDFQKIISKWVENTFNLMGFSSCCAYSTYISELKIPK